MKADTTITLRSGHVMPVIGLGTWELTRDTAASVRHAIELGYRMIDTAVDYGSQAGIGEALNGAGVDRSAIYLVAKVEENDDAFDATRRYLDEMAQDQADLVLIHRPPPHGSGEELWKDLIRARSAGMTRDIGVSNYTIAQIEALADATGEMPVVNQIEWTPFGWSRDMLEFCRAREIVIQAYSPLTRGERLDDPVLNGIAHAHGGTAAQVLLRWNIQLGVVPLPKANDPSHQAENLGALELELSADEMSRLDELNEEWSALGAAPEYL